MGKSDNIKKDVKAWEELVKDEITFKQALEILGIEKYSQRIIDSNSRGELFHLTQYMNLATILGKGDWFVEWFESVVKFAEKNWERPESVFQHIEKVFQQHIKEV